LKSISKQETENSYFENFLHKFELFQVFDILWSDPQPGDGCIPNSLRGAGTYFGPDVTEKFLQKYKLLYLIRSHECKPGGYELTHGSKVRQ
jgi:serine/threonine-protein phosphatase with EF-hand domain